MIFWTLIIALAIWAAYEARAWRRIRQADVDATNAVIGETWTDGTGQTVYHVHPASACALDEGCVIHHPSAHHMVDFPTHWRYDRRIMERICPHGVGHPDPDNARFRASRGDEDTTHGCDGCCAAVA